MIQVDGQLNKIADDPPAYSNSSLTNHAGAQGKSQRHDPSFDQVHILDKRNEIRGTFYIDPSIPSLDPSRNHRRGCKGRRLKLNSPVHATFFTRHKPIFLDLGTTGNIIDTPKANVLVSTKSGDIQINLLSTHISQPRLGLEASSKKGDVVVYLPDDFYGVIHMETFRGSLKVLPVLRDRVKIANQSNRDMTLMVDTRNDPSNHSQEASFCHLRTKKGNVIVGSSSGDDRHVPRVGFWQWIVGKIANTS